LKIRSDNLALQPTSKKEVVIITLGKSNWRIW